MADRKQSTRSWLGWLTGRPRPGMVGDDPDPPADTAAPDPEPPMTATNPPDPVPGQQPAARPTPATNPPDPVPGQAGSAAPPAPPDDTAAADSGPPLAPGGTGTGNVTTHVANPATGPAGGRRERLLAAAGTIPALRAELVEARRQRDAAIAERDTLTHQCHDAERETAGFRGRVDELVAERDAANQRADAASDRADAAERERDAAIAERDDANGILAELEQQLGA